MTGSKENLQVYITAEPPHLAEWRLISVRINTHRERERAIKMTYDALSFKLNEKLSAHTPVCLF